MTLLGQWLLFNVEGDAAECWAQAEWSCCPRGVILESPGQDILVEVILGVLLPPGTLEPILAHYGLWYRRTSSSEMWGQS